jgi:dimethylargininase
MVVCNPAWVSPDAFSGIDVVPVHPDEPFAANVLRVGETVLASAAHPRTNERLARHANVRELDISELAKAEAGLTCMSLLLAD